MPNFVLYLALFKSLLIQSLETEVATNGSVIQLPFSSSHYDILKFALRVCVWWLGLGRRGAVHIILIIL